ncbi:MULTISPECIES: VOC family protein [unclassified Leeuwenhoekiella]|uniref:VOC family protein n=1 Tax=unclassified Leeuwenhoekiella TaxID=2615029 RepID=UPI000C532849|nr:MULTISPECIES: VOC family protein [unclassified Leeuwenhoekiella]MAW96176.1 glyoxalase [Leeuwenhoekiella sp.]MBA80170.1 glyoxalase [Leeuwenhoekiella sp.]|tara:strand:+ start:483 stop:866 length:384 start_codon:yes stop_codon:yes gene_type:complete
MPSFKFNHIALSVKDVNASVDFYQNVFQFEELENTASNSKTRWLSLGEGRELHLIPRPDAVIKTNKAVHFAIATSDLSAFIIQIESLGIAFSDWKDTPSKNYVRDDGIRQVYFQDPDAYWIEVNEAF